MPAASARSATGDRLHLRPRPAGASGRVRTATTSWPESSSASSEGTAGAGVPAKTSRSGGSPHDGLGVGHGQVLRPCPPTRPRRARSARPARASASSRSTNRTPSRWSVSCWMARASSSVPSTRTGSPCMLQPWRRRAGAGGSPSGSPGSTGSPRGRPRSRRRPGDVGVDQVADSPSTYQVKTRRPTPICGAARPAPPAACMVSVRSATSVRSSASKSTTGAAGVLQHGVAEQPDRSRTVHAGAASDRRVDHRQRRDAPWGAGR